MVETSDGSGPAVLGVADRFPACIFWGDGFVSA